MKFIKNNYKIIIIMLAVILLTNGITVYAVQKYSAKDVTYTKSDNTSITVESALNELYRKDNTNNLPRIDKIWSINSASISYSYTATESGMYLVGIGNCTQSGTKGTITTDGEVIIDELLGNENTTYARIGVLKVLNVDTGEKINISGTNGSATANAFIFKLNNISLSSVVSSNYSSDTTATLSYTATQNEEKLVVLAFSFGRDRSSSIEYTGNFLSHDKKQAEICIGYVNLSKNGTVTPTAYGYNWGGAVVAVFK